MRKLLIVLLCLVLLLSGCSQAANTEQAGEVQVAESAEKLPAEENTEIEPDYSGYPIRIYSDSVSPESIHWLRFEAKEAGFTILINDGTGVPDGASLLQTANNKMDVDLVFGLNELHWAELINGNYENLSVADWTPSWADEVGEHHLSGKAYGILLHSMLALYRNDEDGTNGEALHFEHWADVLDSGYQWCQADLEDEDALRMLTAAILFPYVDPESPAGGISVDGWKVLWKYCSGGIQTNSEEETDPLSREGVQIAFCTSSMLSDRYAIPKKPGKPLLDVAIPGNWSPAEIDDGTFCETEYMGILNKAGRTAEETAAVCSFAEWFGSAEVQADWAEYFGGCPCNREATGLLYGETLPDLYAPHNIALDKVGTDQTYSAYAIAHSSEWNNILENLGFFQAGAEEDAAPEPDWENLDWVQIT